MSPRLIVGIVIALASVAALIASPLPLSFAKEGSPSSTLPALAADDSDSDSDSDAENAASEEDSEEQPVTILYTLHNEGYIEPCG